MGDYSRFLAIIEEYRQLFSQLIQVEQEKLNAAVKNQVTFVEDCMNKEQAAILKMRGLEQRREAEQERLGMAGLTFREILEKVPEETAEEMRPLFDSLAASVREFQGVSGSASAAIEVNLHNIQQALAPKKAGGQAQPPAQEKKPGEERHFTSRFV